MNDIVHWIEQHLGRPLESESLDFYSILGLPERTSDIEQIKSSIQSTIALWKAANHQSNPNAAQQVAKLLKQAQAVLLDPAQKANYDSKLPKKQKVAPRRSKSARSNPTHDDVGRNSSKAQFEKEDSIWPVGDPMAAFDASQLKSSPGTVSLEVPTVAKRWNQLQSQWPSLRERRLRVTHAAASTPDQPTVETINPSQSIGTGSSGPKNEVSAAARIEQLRRSRQNRQRLSLGAILIVSLLFLAYASWSFFDNRQKVALAQLRDKTKAATPVTTVLTLNPNPTDSTNNPKSVAAIKTAPPMLPRVGGSDPVTTDGSSVDSMAGNMESNDPKEPMESTEAMTPAKPDGAGETAMEMESPGSAPTPVVTPPVHASCSHASCSGNRACPDASHDRRTESGLETENEGRTSFD